MTSSFRILEPIGDHIDGRVKPKATETFLRSLLVRDTEPQWFRALKVGVRLWMLLLAAYNVNVACRTSLSLENALMCLGSGHSL